MRAITAAQMPVKSLSPSAAISLSGSPSMPRISSRPVTGNIAWAARTLSSPCGNWPLAGVANVPAPAETRISQNIVVHPEAPRLNTSVALRGTNGRVAPLMRDGPRPVPPVPIDSDRASSVKNDGWWQVAQAMSRLPLSTRSKKRSRPRRTFAGEGAGPGSSGPMPCDFSSPRSVRSNWPGPWARAVAVKPATRIKAMENRALMKDLPQSGWGHRAGFFGARRTLDGT
jgi:hypothetical protein